MTIVGNQTCDGWIGSMVQEHRPPGGWRREKKEDEVNRQLVVGLEGLARGGRGTGTSDAERSEFRALQQSPSYGNTAGASWLQWATKSPAASGLPRFCSHSPANEYFGGRTRGHLRRAATGLSPGGR